ncbi:MAG: T9SS type A sorting domain-containing protein [Candidatus Marinimicrobia bacterium]|nr:T9SS type A sorting domain-containing protein [Candidatus Neomarinimicrobiota bacterium]
MKNMKLFISIIFTFSILISQSMTLSHSGITPSSTLVVESGENITFIYGSGGSHPMTSDNDSPVYFPTVTVSSGNPTAVFSLTAVGTYTFHCATNPGNSSLHGTIIVEASEPDFTLGDVNDDGVINILDIVGIVNHIMGTATLPVEEAGDVNTDGIINILDIVQIVNIIMGSRVDSIDATATFKDNILYTTGSVGGIQFIGNLVSAVMGNDTVVSNNGITVIYNVDEGILSTESFVFDGHPINLIIASSIGENVEITNEFTLMNIYPNPFNPQTSINYELSVDSFVSLDIYNMNGQLVNQLVNKTVSAGMNSVVWNGINSAGMDVSAGVYLVKLNSNGNSISQMVSLLK